ncbi:serine protease inhibitor A3L-like [Salarias fasciatus]|uniref:serine protease inhibitor A3L-like n=1 Tax=Salarias fasciatus TaxID=181472 RepID=UPI001176EF43|nr:serine protease inhibitor A3L-like [Salarias fasciatus]
MKFIMLQAALGIWVLSALVCEGTADHHEGHHSGAQDTAPDNSASLVNSANKEFAFQLYRKLSAHADTQGKNIFFSPRSVSVALAALSAGARGETQRQLHSGLGFNNSQLTQADVDQAFHTLLERSNQLSPEDTSEGTAVFVDQRFKPYAEFLEVLKQSYFADGFAVDFTQTTDSANAINKYVSDKTHGKIEKLVESVDPSTVMYLLSYIYFKGTWATPFVPELTKKDTFNLDETAKVPVQMMNMENNFDVYYDVTLNTSVLHLPFNSSYSMLLMLPDDMATLEKTICPGHVTKWLKWMKTRRYDVSVPKFSIKSSYTLNDILIEMGMADMFSDRADLTGISEGQKLVVSEVVHKATLDVDETGATATAATGIGITLLSFQHIPVLKFNRPFMVVITDRNAGDYLFIGRIMNPNAEE